MSLIVLHLVCSECSTMEFKSVQEYCRNHSCWNEGLNAVTTIHAYKEVVHVLLQDGISNKGRLMVLKVFTCDLCDRYPSIATEVRAYYKKRLDAENSHWCSFS